jgi:hypothetical protein
MASSSHRANPSRVNHNSRHRYSQSLSKPFHSTPSSSQPHEKRLKLDHETIREIANIAASSARSATTDHQASAHQSGSQPLRGSNKGNKSKNSKSTS